MAVLIEIPEGDPDLTIYLNEVLRRNKSEKQNNTNWFPTPKIFGKTDDHTPIQARILRELRELKERGKLNRKGDVESRMKFLQRFEWTDTLVRETERNRQWKTF